MGSQNIQFDVTFGDLEESISKSLTPCIFQVLISHKEVMSEDILLLNITRKSYDGESTVLLDCILSDIQRSNTRSPIVIALLRFFILW